MKLKQLTFSLVFIGVCFTICFAQTDRDKGIQLFENGDLKGAVESLNAATNADINDIVSLYYLGLANEKLNRPEKAVDSFERAINACVEFVNIAIENQVGLTGLGENQNSLDKYFKVHAKELETGYLSILKFSILNAKEAKAKKWQKRFTLIESFAPNSEIAKSFGSGKPTTNLKITSKRFAQAQGNGVVRFRVLFLSDGKIGAIVPLNFLSKETNEAAMRAAMDVKFTPAYEDGKPVSIWKVVEYSFRTY